MRRLVEEVTTRFSRSETVLPYASIEAQERSATVLQLYCNRTDMYWYRIEKATPQDYRKSPKKARFPYASGRARTCASKLVMRRGQRFESARRISNTLRLREDLSAVLSVRLVQTMRKDGSCGTLSLGIRACLPREPPLGRNQNPYRHSPP